TDHSTWVQTRIVAIRSSARAPFNPLSERVVVLGFVRVPAARQARSPGFSARMAFSEANGPKVRSLAKTEPNTRRNCSLLSSWKGGKLKKAPLSQPFSWPIHLTAPGVRVHLAPPRSLQRQRFCAPG